MIFMTAWRRRLERRHGKKNSYVSGFAGAQSKQKIAIMACCLACNHGPRLGDLYG
jgi:hypothetical protein